MLTISHGAEERLLTQKFKPFIETRGAVQAFTNRCYMQRVHPHTDPMGAYAIGWDKRRRGHSPAHQYELLCVRFGSERVNRAIRLRILSNQMWRAMVAERNGRKGAVQPEGRSNLVREPAR